MTTNKHPLYTRWRWILQAKFNPNSPDYHYGHQLKLGFRNFLEFADYVESLPRPDASYKILHRIDQDQGWVPGNLIWATSKQASNNRPHCEFVTHQGETHSLKEWSEILGMSYWTIRDRYFNQGMTFDEIINIPNRKTGQQYARS